MTLHLLKLSALTNVANVKDTNLGDILLAQRLLEHLGRLEHLLHGQRPRAPVDAHGAGALCVAKDLDRVVRVGVHSREGHSRVVCANGDQAEIERSAELANLLELWAPGESFVVGTVVVDSGRDGWNSTVSSVATEPDRLFVGANSP